MFFTRQIWKLRRSAKSSLHGSLDAAAFSQKKFDLAAAGKSRWIVVVFFHRHSKKKLIFFHSS
jgi:hypothetical protein